MLKINTVLVIAFLLCVACNYIQPPLLEYTLPSTVLRIQLTSKSSSPQLFCGGFIGLPNNICESMSRQLREKDVKKPDIYFAHVCLTVTEVRLPHMLEDSGLLLSR